MEEFATVHTVIQISGVCSNSDYEKVKELIKIFREELEKLNVIVE